jgi:hypothetical protein
MNLPTSISQALFRHFSARLEGMRNDRLSFWYHWGQLAEVLLPRRYKWFITPNQTNRGAQINQAIIDETGVLASRVCSSGMMAGLTSPSSTWFKLSFEGLDLLEFGPGRVWLAEVERRMARVFAESNFYQALATLHHDNAVFGSAALIMYEDSEEVIRCYSPCLGEFFFGTGPRFDVDSLYREFVVTIYAAVGMFGLNNLSEATQDQFKRGGGSWSQEIVIRHGIEPNTPLYADNGAMLNSPVPPKFAYREVYWEASTSGTKLISCTPFHEKPFVGARWDVTSNDAYGRSPGMDALPAVRQLQIQQRRKGEAIDKMVRPPMNAAASMRNEPTSILPGAVNYVSDVTQAGFKPAYLVDPRIEEMLRDIDGTQGRVRETFFVDLFMMISSLDTVRTATEINARREEKLIQLGPVIERFANEVLDPLIDRTFAIMLRRGLLPEPPPEIAGQPIKVEYVSMLAQAQKAAKTAGIERILQLLGNLVGAVPDIMDNLDTDVAVEDYADGLDLNPRVIRPMKEVQALRAKRAQDQQQAQTLMATDALSKAGKNLSQTQVGGGLNAIEAMTQ